MSVVALLQRCAAEGVAVYLAGDDVKLRGRQEAVARLAPVLRPYKGAIRSYLGQSPTSADPALRTVSDSVMAPASDSPNRVEDALENAMPGAASFVPVSAEAVMDYRNQIAEAVQVLQAHGAWCAEQAQEILRVSRRQPADTLRPDAVLLVDMAKAVTLGQAAIAQVKGCCAACENRTSIVTALKTGCRAARLQPHAPWRDWLDADGEPNDCSYFERKS